MYSLDASNLLSLAETIAPEHYEAVRAELGNQAPAMALLLGSVFPPLRARHDWQLDALRSVSREGWSAQRQRVDYVGGLRASLAALLDPGDVGRALRRYAWREKARIALRELIPAAWGGAGLTATARELSELAEALLEVAVAHAAAWAQERWGAPRRSDGSDAELIVLGLGKLGGLELNAGSDIDLIFLYDTDDGGSRLSLHEHWTHVVRRTVAVLDESTADGRVWRVDLRLRPEGSRGAVVNSVAAAERYYETWGRMWERAAMLRARCCLGQGALWDNFSRDVLAPFVYRRKVDPSIAREMVEMVQRSRLELSSAPSRDLKLGPGGIREAEFFVQALQLIWGGVDPSVRSPSTLAGLARLRSRGLVTDREATTISDAYLLLRRVEHRVQWMSGLQTHLLPSTETELDTLAMTLGYDRGESLTERLELARHAVETMFHALAPEAPRPQGAFHVLLARIDSAVRCDELTETCRELLGDAEVADHLFALAHRPDSILGDLTRSRYPELAAELLEAIAGASDPELAARYLRAFFSRFEAVHPYVTAFAEDPLALRRLVAAVGASTLVGDAIVAHPDLSLILMFGELTAPDARARVREELALVSDLPESDPFERREAFVGALRRAKRRVAVELAVADLASAVELRTVTRTLSDLADEVLIRAVNYAFGGAPSGLAVIAVGKLGGRDIGYGSDLDVIFVFDPDAAPDPDEAAQYFIRRAQTVIRLISTAHPEGPGYELDTRLRPSGSEGMLVTSLASFARYHGVSLSGTERTSGMPSVSRSRSSWERQALLRARASAGDEDLGVRVEAIAAEAAYERGPAPIEEMHYLRMRMERELAKENKYRADLKTGRGGLLDIEFLTQWLQMAHGFDRSVRTPDTLVALAALRAGGYLEERHHAVLTDGYAFLRRLEQRMHVLRGAGDSVIDRRELGLPQLARRMGFQTRGNVPEKDVMLSHYRQVTERVRSVYCEVLGVKG